MSQIFERIASELGARPAQVEAAVRLLDEGATVPFIARYRKEVTGALDDTQLRTLEERLTYLRELDDRRATILKSIEEQGKLTEALKASILAADTKNRLEDLYLPYKPRRRTKGQIAREAGLEPLAHALRENPSLDPRAEAEGYVDADKGVADVDAALEGARYILMEELAEQADLLERLRNWLWDDGILRVRVVEGKENEGVKFRDYFEHDEPLKGVPSHRALAILRGRNEGVLTYSIGVEGEPEDRRTPHPGELKVAAWAGWKDEGRPADAWLREVVRWTWRVKLSTSLETDLMARVRERAEDEAIRVFGANLKDLLMAPPAGPRAVMGLDPGLRTGVKVAVVDPTGKLVAHTAIFPHAPQNRFEEAVRTVAELCRAHQVELVSIGNGTASRETDRFVGEVIKRHPELRLTKVIVNEAGASVYSASELAAREFPDLDVTIRGAVSIA
ncbi:MAG: RNA-binding transcriptional accessory protein, partial [Gammaproteobacteria bacterium]